MASTLNAANVLANLGQAVRVIELLEQEQSKRAAEEYLLVLNSSDKSITVYSFSRKQLSSLEEHYLRLEKEGNPDVQVVQVSVENITALRTAYPNYYLDAQAFIAALNSAIAEK